MNNFILNLFCESIIESIIIFIYKSFFSGSWPTGSTQHSGPPRHNRIPSPHAGAGINPGTGTPQPAPKPSCRSWHKPRDQHVTTGS